MSKSKIIKAGMIIFAFIKSPILGLMILGYLIVMEDKCRNLKNQILASIEEDKVKKKPFKMPMTTASKFDIYKDCFIEQHGDKFYIKKPSGEYLEKIFNKIENAKEEIDIIEPFLEKKKANERYKVHNIRFVK
jgi:hypothetical protein